MRGGGLRGCCNGSGPSAKSANIIPIVDAGIFRQKVYIQAPYLVQDNRGGGIYNWSTIATVWAHIKTDNPQYYSSFVNKERFEEGQMRARDNYLVTIRYTSDTITTAMRVIYNGRDFEIESVINVDELNWTIALLCKELGTGEP